MTSGWAPCACTTRAGPKAGVSGGMCSAPTISTTCATRGAASPNIRATSTTFRRTSVGLPPITSRRIRFISGVRMCRANLRSTTKAARAEIVRAPQSLHDDLDLFAGLEAVMRAEAIEHAETVKGVIGGRHAVCELFDRIVCADRNDLEAKRFDLLALLQGHAAEGHDGFAKLLVDLCGSVLGSENKAIDVTAETHRKNAERPISAAGCCGYGLKAVDGKFLDAGGIDIFHPSRLQVVGQRLFGRHAHHVYTQGFAAALLEAEHGLGGIVEREAGWGHKTEAEFWMQEMPAARKAFTGIIAVNETVEVGEIFGAIALAGAGTGELARIRQRVFHAVRGRRMAGQKIKRTRIRPAGAGLQISTALHVRQETRCAIRVESGARRNADPDTVGFEFLCAGESGQRQLGFGERQRSHLRVAEHIVDDMIDDRDLASLLLTNCRMACDHVTHLMREN